MSRLPKPPPRLRTQIADQVPAIAAIETDLSRDQDDELTAQFYKVAPYWKTPDEGSSTTLVAALDPALNGELASSPTPMAKECAG